MRVPDRLPVPAGPHLHLPGGLQLQGEVRDRARLRGDRGRVLDRHRGRGGILGGARQLPDEYQGRSYLGVREPALGGPLGGRLQRYRRQVAEGKAPAREVWVSSD